MILSNKQVYRYYPLLLQELFQQDNVPYLSAKINFILNKNKNILEETYQTIEQAREDIIRHYGSIDSSGNIIVPDDKISIANAELSELLLVSQDLPILTVKLGELNNYEFSVKQMEALFFMIEED